LRVNPGAGLTIPCCTDEAFSLGATTIWTPGAIDRRCSRRYRQRLRNGIKLLVVAIANAQQTFDAWIALGLIVEEQRGDKAALEAALATLARAGYRAIHAGAETQMKDRGERDTGRGNRNLALKSLAANADPA
jgi:hypothetical protein